MKIFYALDTMMNAMVGETRVLALHQGIWYMHPDNEGRFIADSQRYNFEAVRLFETSGLAFECGAKTIEWPDICEVDIH